MCLFITGGLLQPFYWGSGIPQGPEDTDRPSWPWPNSGGLPPTFPAQRPGPCALSPVAGHEPSWSRPWPTACLPGLTSLPALSPWTCLVITGPNPNPVLQIYVLARPQASTINMMVRSWPGLAATSRSVLLTSLRCCVAPAGMASALSSAGSPLSSHIPQGAASPYCSVISVTLLFCLTVSKGTSPEEEGANVEELSRFLTVPSLKGTGEKLPSCLVFPDAQLGV